MNELPYKGKAFLIHPQEPNEILLHSTYYLQYILCQEGAKPSRWMTYLLATTTLL